jgi:hypothetical protein
MELYKHPFYTFVYDPDRKVLSFNWTAETASMQVHDFQEAVHNFAGFALDHPVRGLLVDLRQLRFRPPASLGYWRDQAVSPRYVKAGVKRLAYLAPPGMIDQMRSAPDEYRDRRGFEEAYFASEGEALAWLGP